VCYHQTMPIDWASISRRFKEPWVALSDDEQTVVGSGNSAKQTLRKAQAKGHRIPILTQMPDRLGTSVGL
jgi:hypothetical protein